MAMLGWLEQLIDTLMAVIPRQRPMAEVLTQARLIAHRGAHDRRHDVVENTLPAFEAARRLGCWGVELDVRVTQDGVLVVHHDATLKRLWGVDVDIAQCDYQQLKNVAPMIPTLAEVVERFGRAMHLFIELKAPFDAQTTLSNILAQLKPCRDYHLLSLDKGLFESLDAFPMAALLLVPVQWNVADFVHTSLSRHYGGVLGHYLLLTDALIARLSAAGQMAGVGFVNSRFSLYRELNRGMVYVFSDRARQVSQVLKQSS